METCNCGNQRKKLRPVEEKRAIENRLSRIGGQINGIKAMVEEYRYCGDILIQLAAAEKSIKSLASVILEKHMHSCLIDDLRAGNTQSVDELIELFKRFQ